MEGDRVERKGLFRMDRFDRFSTSTYVYLRRTSASQDSDKTWIERGFLREGVPSWK